MLPCQQTASKKISSRLLAKYDMKAHHVTVKKNHSRKNRPENP